MKNAQEEALDEIFNNFLEIKYLSLNELYIVHEIIREIKRQEKIEWEEIDEWITAVLRREALIVIKQEEKNGRGDNSR